MDENPAAEAICPGAGEINPPEVDVAPPKGDDLMGEAANLENTSILDT